MLLLDQYLAEVIIKENNEQRLKALHDQHLARAALSQRPSQPSKIAQLVGWFSRHGRSKNEEAVPTNDASIDVLHRTVIHH